MTHLEPDDFRDTTERERMTRVLTSLRDEPVELFDPPPDLWSRIEEVTNGDTHLPATITRHADATTDTAAGATVTPLRARWAGRQVLLAAAALLLVVGVVGAVVATRDEGPSTRVIATARLDQLEDLGSTAVTARLEERDGVDHLVIDATAMPAAPDGSDYELWLIDKDATDPRSLGTVSGSADVVVPKSIDPRRHPLVDISLEPRDGDHQHSGHSLMRGELT